MNIYMNNLFKFRPCSKKLLLNLVGVSCFILT